MRPGDGFGGHDKCDNHGRLFVLIRCEEKSGKVRCKRGLGVLHVAHPMLYWGPRAARIIWRVGEEQDYYLSGPRLLEEDCRF